MGVPRFIGRWLNQTLVYWGNPQRKGTGNFTYDAPIEIMGRCEYKVETIKDEFNQEVLSKARVYLKQRVDTEGFLYLGTLADSAIGDNQSPQDTEGSMRIIAFEEIPRVNGKGSIYRVYVNITRWR